MTKSIVFRSARVFDGKSEALRVGVNEGRSFPQTQNLTLVIAATGCF